MDLAQSMRKALDRFPLRGGTWYPSLVGSEPLMGGVGYADMIRTFLLLPLLGGVGYNKNPDRSRQLNHPTLLTGGIKQLKLLKRLKLADWVTMTTGLFHLDYESIRFLFCMSASCTVLAFSRDSFYTHFRFHVLTTPIIIHH